MVDWGVGWSVGIVEEWNVGMLECWSVGVLENCVAGTFILPPAEELALSLCSA